MARTWIARRWTAAEARRVVAAWRESGQSMSAFARERGFDAQRLRWWRKRFAEWSSGGEERPVRFAPAVISTAGGLVSPQVSLRLPEGVLIEVAGVGTVPPGWLSELVSMLRGEK